ncbi:MAG: DUF3011 domain-containing protein [Bdellovibrionota bacterium]
MKQKILALAAMFVALGTAVTAEAQNQIAATVRQTYRNGQTIKVKQLLNLSSEYEKAKLQNVQFLGQALQPGVVLTLLIDGVAVAQGQAPNQMATLTYKMQGNVSLKGKTLQLRVQGGDYYLDSIKAKFKNVGNEPGQPYPGQPYPGQPYPGQPYPGQPYPGQPYPGQPGPVGYQVVQMTCASLGPLNAQCSINNGRIYTAQLINQLSSSNHPCVYGQTWWFDARSVYVSNGCKATFRVWVQ